MPKDLTPFQKHQRKWLGCTRCLLHGCRTNVVLTRGRERGRVKLPVDVLYIGEGPGDSEDTFGSPFIGPAGLLLNEIIECAEIRAGVRPVIAFTNLVACIPKTKGVKIHEPPTEAIRACQPRLLEFVDIAKPKVIVLVGALAARHCPGVKTHSIGGRVVRFVEITHPAAILKTMGKNSAQRSVIVQKTVVVLQDMLETL